MAWLPGPSLAQRRTKSIFTYDLSLFLFVTLKRLRYKSRRNQRLEHYILLTAMRYEIDDGNQT